MTDSSGEGQVFRLTNKQKKQILKELTEGNPLNKVAENYGTFDRTIQRVRQWALKKPGFRSSLDQNVQDYLTDWERARSKKAVKSTNVPLENVTNQVTLTNKNHNDEQSSKAKITSRHYADHIKVLSCAAIGIADLLYYFKLCNFSDTVRQMLDENEATQQYEKYEEFMKLVPSPEAKWLLSHIKSEAAELFIHFLCTFPPGTFDHPSHKAPESKDINSWEDMTMDDINVYGEKLIHLLKLRVARREFLGTCEVCKDWKATLKLQ
jgi:hypothetical protein